MNLPEPIKGIWSSGVDFVTPAFRGVVDWTGQVFSSCTKKPEPIVKEIVKPVDFSKMPLPFNRHLIRIAGISGALAVGLGAYGSHVLVTDEKISEGRKNSFRAANMYHFFGTFGLAACSLSKYPYVSGTLMIVGSGLFCGACYYHGFTGEPKTTKVAPFGGTLLIVAWLSLML